MFFPVSEHCWSYLAPIRRVIRDRGKISQRSRTLKDGGAIRH
jgi:hypothetical protein